MNLNRQMHFMSVKSQGTFFHIVPFLSVRVKANSPPQSHCVIASILFRQFNLTLTSLTTVQDETK